MIINLNVRLPRAGCYVLRVDGRAFHTYLRNCPKPFDPQFMLDMDKVSQELCKEISGARLAFVQSDEISVLYSIARVESDPWFGGVLNKQVSIGAALASSVFNSLRTGELALFDARVLSLATPEAVVDYFVCRQKNALTNAIQMVAQTIYPAKELHGKRTSELESSIDIDWEKYPPGSRLGRVTCKQSGVKTIRYVDKRTDEEHEIETVRNWWETKPAEVFDSDYLLSFLQ